MSVRVESRPAESVLTRRTNPLDYSRHLFAAVRAKRGCANVPCRAQFEEEGGSGLLVGRFGDDGYVMRADGPVDLLDPYVVLLCEFLGPLATLYGISKVPDALVGPVEEADVGRHSAFSFLLLLLHTPTYMMASFGAWRSFSLVTRRGRRIPRRGLLRTPASWS